MKHKNNTRDTSEKNEVLEVEKEKLSETWAADAQDELEEWIEEQGIQLRY